MGHNYWISFTLPLLIIGLSATAILCWFRRITPLQGALAGFLVFISLSNQVNYQYLIVYIPLAILLAATTKFKFERIFALVIAILPAFGCGSIMSHGGSITWNHTSTGRTIF